MSRKKEPITPITFDDIAKAMRVDAVKVVRHMLYDGDKQEFRYPEEITERGNIYYPTGDYTLAEIKDALLTLEEELEVEKDKKGRYRLTEVGRLHQETGDDFERVLEANYIRRLLQNEAKKKEALAELIKRKDEMMKAEKEKEAKRKVLKHDRFQVLSADQQTACNPNGEKRRCLVIDKSLDAKSVHHDVKLGAQQYQCIADAEPVDLSAKVSVIRSEKLEDGLLALNYLAPIHFEMDHVDKQFECIDPEGFNVMAYNPDGVETTSYNVIPLVAIGEVVNTGGWSPLPFGMGNVSGNIAVVRNPVEPYWFGHTGPIALICAGGSPVYDPDNALLADAISALGEKSRVYILFQDIDSAFFDDDMKDARDHGDAKLISAVDRYDATVYDILVKDRVGYIKHVMEGLCDTYGLTISSDYPEERLIERLNATYSDMQILHLRNLIRREKRRSKDNTLSYSPIKLLGRIDSDMENRKEGREKLYSLEGMDAVKESVESLIDAMKLSKARRAKGLKSEPIACVMFTGAPGTGKTEVAGCLAKMLADEGLLPGKRFTSLTAAGLQGEFVGTTVGRVKQTFEQYDCIFLDEAYSLSDLMKQHVPYAEEAMATLLCEIENAQRTGSKLVILGGYGGSKSDERSNKMREFLQSNPGIRSRIAMTVEFENYDAEAMSKIFMRICKNDGYEFTPDASETIINEVKTYFSSRVSSADFGNAREARQLVGESERFAAMRIMRGRSMTDVSEDELKSLTEEDVRNAIASVKKMAQSQNGMKEKTLRMIG